MTASTAPPPPAPRRNWGGRPVTDRAIEDASGIDRTIISRLRSGAIGRVSDRVARAFAFALAWPIGEQYEAHARGAAAYSAQLDAAAIRVGLGGAERAEAQAEHGVSPWPGAIPQLPPTD